MLIPPWKGGEARRCYNHPERMADGKCNDCGRSFCVDCLEYYNLNTREDRAVLSLCPACFRRRYVHKADGTIYAGIVGILGGVFFLFISYPLGVVALVLSLGMIGYGAWQREQAPEEPSVNDLQAAEEEKDAEPSVREDFDITEAYDKLVTYYVSHWGVQTGTDLLDKEIMAYIRQGESFPDAVEKICRRQEKKIRNI